MRPARAAAPARATRRVSAATCDRLDHALARAQAELDDDVGQRARDAVAAASAAARPFGADVAGARRGLVAEAPAGAAATAQPRCRPGRLRPSPRRVRRAPVQCSKLRAPWATRIARPSTTATPSSRAAATSGVGSRRVDEVDDIRTATQQIGIQAQRRERVGSRSYIRPCRRSSRSPADRPLAAARSPRRRIAAASSRARCGRAVPDGDLGARARAAPRRRRGPCPRRRARPRRAPGRVDARARRSVPGASVFSASIAPSAAKRQRVGGADLARGDGSRCRRARARRACAAPSRSRRRSPRRAAPARSPSKSSGGTGQQLVGPAAQPERGDRGALHRRRAAVADRPAEHAERRRPPRAVHGQRRRLRARRSAVARLS